VLIQPSRALPSNIQVQIGFSSPMADDPPPHFVCPIFQTVMSDPVMEPAGHSYERSAIESWLARNGTSPTTRESLQVGDLLPNRNLRDAISAWQATHGELNPDDITQGRQIGVGSYKTVYQGELRRGGRHVPCALLRIRQPGAAVEEAATLRKLGPHPHLIRYYGVLHDGGTAVLVTELAPLGSLADYMAEHDLERTHDVIAGQIASAMQALAALQIVHCDLAARNVLVVALDESCPSKTLIKVTDFGLALSVAYKTHAYQQTNELPYRWMPPESLRSRRFTGKSDVWAFGVLIYELLSNGELPYFAVSSNDDVIRGVADGSLTLELPQDAPAPHLWSIAKTHCFSTSAKDRPTFTEIVAFIHTAASAASGDIYYHGTSLAAALSIQKDGFDVTMSGSNAGAMLGDGVYVTKVGVVWSDSCNCHDRDTKEWLRQQYRSRPSTEERGEVAYTTNIPRSAWTRQ